MSAESNPIQPTEADQPALFQPEQLPDVPAMERAAKEYAHTGKIVTRDHARAEMVLTHYLQSGSLRATAKHMGCSPRSIHRMLEAFAESGKLAALKERLSHRLGLILELSADDMVDKVERGILKLSSIDWAVLADKKLLFDGEATQISQARIEVDIRTSDVVSYLRSKGIAAPAIDIESTVSPPKPKETTP